MRHHQQPPPFLSPTHIHIWPYTLFAFRSIEFRLFYTMFLATGKNWEVGGARGAFCLGNYSACRSSGKWNAYSMYPDVNNILHIAYGSFEMSFSMGFCMANFPCLACRIITALIIKRKWMLQHNTIRCVRVYYIIKPPPPTFATSPNERLLQCL